MPLHETDNTGVLHFYFIKTSQAMQAQAREWSEPIREAISQLSALSNESKVLQSATMSTVASALDLLKNRNRSIGWLLSSERAVPYVEILLALLQFRDNHELEPLHDDLLSALASTTDQVADGQAQFTQDIRQLLDWNLVTQRIEKERLRGYRDTRRRKFRYRISEDAISFLLWLESRYQDDLHPVDTDTRDLLSDIISSLREMSRLIYKVSADHVDYEEARAVFHRLEKTASTTDGVAKSLGEFNVRLLSFVGGTYDIPKARQLIKELERFLEKFIRRIYTLRNEIAPEIEKLQALRLFSRWEACTRLMMDEASATPSIMRARILNPAQTLSTLADFYHRDGQLEQLTSRVNQSAMLVWQKLHSHLRELERRSHRLDDVRCRILDLSTLPPTTIPHTWFQRVVQQGHLVGDMHEWSESIRAIPPQPVWSKHQLRTQAQIWMEPRPLADDKPVQSLEERRLEVLSTWMREHGILPESGIPVRLSSGHYGDFNDFAQIMNVVRSGILGNGRRLAKIGAAAEFTDDPALATTGEFKLAFSDIALRKIDHHDNPD